MNLREINPPGRASRATLLGQVRRVVIQHRQKVKHDERKPA